MFYKSLSEFYFIKKTDGNRKIIEGKTRFWRHID